MAAAASKVDINRGFWSCELKGDLDPSLPIPENKAAPERTPTTIHEITKFDQIVDVILRRFDEVKTLGLPEHEFNARTFAKVICIIAIDDCVIMDTKTLGTLITEMPGKKDCKLRGPTNTVGKTTYTQCEPDNLKTLETLRIKGALVIFITSRGKEFEEDTRKKLKAFGIIAPLVWSTDRTPRGPFVKKEIPDLSDRTICVIDSSHKNLTSFTNTYTPDQLTLIQYDALSP
ncbi:MAG: hypothetical protein Hyperionvirus15_39 [Hyperionvirus sp.]|uniref:Uncharacterized protein n=1 Tax=Hyperionvirus sp. TaxID=2487770 RepID=A0A3G5ACL2_9VIRU|nr:MAG: hypothetical protein Hyperionvirus15_39 [Hyperionvirus sp.]